MEDVRCPECNGSKLERYGKTKAGKQKFRCLEPFCRRQFVLGGDDRSIDQATLETVLKLLAQNVKPRVIKTAVPGISLRSIYKLRGKT